MARFTNIKCGNCNYSFTGGYASGRKSILGESKVECPKCFVINSTSSKPYSQFSLWNLILFWFGRITSTLILGLIYGGILGYMISLLFDSSSTDSYIFSGLTIGVIGNMIYSYFNIKEEINEAEKQEVKFDSPELVKEKLTIKASAKAQTAKEYYLRGNAKSALENYDGAIADYNKAIDLDINYASAYYERGQLRMDLKMYKQGVEDFAKVKELRGWYRC